MNSNNNLDKYFLQAQKAENPERFFSEDEIRSITEKGYNSGNLINKLWKKLKRKKIMYISLMTLITSSLMFFMFNDGEQLPEKQATTNQQKITNQYSQNNTLDSTESEKGFSEKLAKSIVAGFEDVAKNPDAYPLLKLTDKELEKIGLKKVGLNYEFIVEHTMIGKTYGPYFDEVIKAGYNPSNQESLVRAKYLLDTITAHVEVIPNQNYTITNASKVVPYAYISNQDSKHQYGDCGLAVYFKNPHIDSRCDSYLANQLRNFQSEQLGFRNYTLQKMNSIILDKKYNSIMRELVPVHIHYGDKNAGADAIIWYLPTQDFLNLIPDRYKYIVNVKYNPVEKFTIKDDMKQIKPINNNLIPFKIYYGNGIRYIYLDANDDWVKSLEYLKKTIDGKTTVEISYKDLKKIRFSLKKSIEKFHPPSIDILMFENDTIKFEKLLRKSVDNAVGNATDIAKVQLYSYICKTFAYDIKGIEEIELNDEELEKINVFKDSVGYFALRDVKLIANKDQQEESYFKNDNGTFGGIDINENSMSKILVMGPSKKLLSESGYDIDTKDAYYRNKVRLYRNTFWQTNIDYTGWDMRTYLKVQPIAIAYNSKYQKNDSIKTNGFVSVFNYSPIYNFPDSLYWELKWKQNSFVTAINKLIPIKIGYYSVIDRDSIKLISSEYTLWYLLNEDLIKALPERYHKGLQREYELITSVSEGEIPLVEACKQMEEHESYLDLCRYESASIKDLVVFPNPIRDNKFNIKFNLSKNCNIRIDIHEVSGKFIANIDNTQRRAGTNEFQLELGKLISSGVYLLSLKTNTGEQVVRRLIVE